MKIKILSIMLLVIMCAGLVLTGCGRGSNPATTTTLKGTKTTTSTTHEATTEQNEEVVVTFACPELELLVRLELQIDSEPITSTDMLGLESIRPNGESISSLIGLEYAKNLSDFGILRNEIELDSLEPISNLTSLTRISVSYTTVSKSIAFGNLEQVTYLSFIDTNISDIGSLANLPAIQQLTLSDCGISDIGALANMTDLTSVNLYGNNIASMEALRNKSQIESLNIQGNQISDISPMADMTNLQMAVLSYNPITNLKPLEDLPNLQELTIYQDHDVKHLIFDQVAILEGKGIEVLYHR